MVATTPDRYECWCSLYWHRRAVSPFSVQLLLIVT